LRRRLALQERAFDKRGAAATLHLLGEAGDVITPEVDAYYARAMEAFEALADPAEVALVEMDRAGAWSFADDHERAIAMGEHALKLRLEISNDQATAAAMDNLGLLYDAAGDRSKAISLMERSLSLTEELDDKEGMLIVLCNLASQYSRSDREANAIECYRRALALAKAVNDLETRSMVLEELERISLS
jgi:tetratricopeptide (TPR) repeat protein